ncbi:MAG TPA: NAD-dependent epimerase/dehydratase family protein [Kiritimatiellae bacterium]|nr:NAD-dependent epimerase/dehydratase family protein [Kiritimatiellia bacterium]
MRVLVTGAAGFVGGHLIRELESAGHSPVLMDLRPPAEGSPHLFIAADITDPSSVESAFIHAKPDACVHLAGIAYVPTGWREPTQTLGVNLLGTLTVLEAVRQVAPHCRTLVVTSAEIYGRDDPGQPLTEDAPLHPQNPYAVSKAGADICTLLFARHHQIPCLTARPANHCGPGQSASFVVPSFARQLALVKLGLQPPEMKVGNLDSVRTFIDVRDVVRAYRLLLEKASPGKAYNVAGRERVRIGDILEILCDVAGVRPRLVRDPDRYRPTDSVPLLDTRRLCEETGWEPRLSLRQSLQDVFQHELQRLHA